MSSHKNCGVRDHNPGGLNQGILPHQHKRARRAHCANGCSPMLLDGRSETNEPRESISWKKILGLNQSTISGTTSYIELPAFQSHMNAYAHIGTDVRLLAFG
jgi:hypothetical protein